MKNRIQIIILALIAIITPSASAQTVPASLPIGSKETLTAFAVMQTSLGTMSHSSNTMLSKVGDASYFYYTGADLGKLVSKLASAPASFDVANTGDQISTYVQIKDSQWGDLFWGYRNGQLLKSGSAWKLPIENVNLHLADWITIPFLGAEWATLILRDANGNPIDWRNVEVHNGNGLYFQTALAGWGTELMVTYRTADGNYAQVAYSVPNKGKMIVPSNVSGFTNVGIENMSFHDDSMNNTPSPVISLNAFYNSQGTSGVSLLHARLDFAHQFTVIASATSSDIYGAPVLRPTKFVIIQSQGGVITSEMEVVAAGNGSATFTLYPGTYEIIPIYPGDIFKQKVLPKQYYGVTTTVTPG